MAFNGQTDLFMSPQDAELDTFNDFTPDLDYLDGDNSFDFDNADLGGDMIGSLPGGSGEQHEKRKNPDENDEEEEGDAKRQETQDGEKGSKKPGRKPLTSEPTTKRKAQNRAAQRAFRERKEKHLKDLETKVSELTKAQEADKQEKGVLKAQVDRLQVELKEYRKRLSLNGSSSRSPTLAATTGLNRSNSGSAHNSSQFQFEFPKFGGLPGTQIFGNQGYSSDKINAETITPPLSTNSSIARASASQSPANILRQESSGSNSSPRHSQDHGVLAGSPSQWASLMPSTGYSTNNNMHGFADTLPQMNNNPFGDLFSPSLLKSANVDGNNLFNGSQQTNVFNTASADDGGDSTAGLNRVFQFNSASSTSDSASPASSSQWNVNGTSNSSCGTSPEPSTESPRTKAGGFVDKVNPLRSYQSPPSVAQTTNNTFSNTSYDIPSTSTFDPVLFNDYRDSQSQLFGVDSFAGGFFDDALTSAPLDFPSPSNLFGILQSPQQSNATLGVASAPANAVTPSQNLLAQIDQARDGTDEGYGSSFQTSKPTMEQKDQPRGKLISCNNIWNQLQSNTDFQEGKFDLDNLCAELRVKATCAESGVMVDEEHVAAALKKLGSKNQDPRLPGLMLPQESWDSALQKLGNGGRK